MDMCFCFESGPNGDISGRNSCHNGHKETTTERSLRKMTASRNRIWAIFFSGPQGWSEAFALAMDCESKCVNFLTNYLFFLRPDHCHTYWRIQRTCESFWLNKFFGCVSLPKKCVFFSVKLPWNDGKIMVYQKNARSMAQKSKSND